MAIKSEISEDQQTLSIYVEGNFDFNLHKEFRDAYAPLKQPVTKCVVDMSGTEYMDSSALGMLLILRDQAELVDAKVVLANCTEEIKGILSIANFDEMFEMV